MSTDYRKWFDNGCLKDFFTHCFRTNQSKRDGKNRHIHYFVQNYVEKN